MDKNKNTKGEKGEVKSKKPRKKSKLITFFKEAFSELKKVSWPNFSTVFKTTLVVLGMVAVFVVVLFVFDFSLEMGHGVLLAPNEPFVLPFLR